MFNVSKRHWRTSRINGFKGINMFMTKLVILLYADDIVVFSDSTEGQQNDLDSLFIFRDGNSKLMSWKLK